MFFKNALNLRRWDVFIVIDDPKEVTVKFVVLFVI
jgi:hypothetical protein